jgi:HAE1 family hydrophobic/amphiphilic exporter-1
VKSVLSQSYEGASVLIVEFSMDIDIEAKEQEAQRKINNILSELPEDVESPSISRVSPVINPLSISQSFLTWVHANRMTL